jgi:hypothetical protein
MADKKKGDGGGTPGGPKGGKKSYVTPALIAFGSLTLLTGKAFAISIT